MRRLTRGDVAAAARELATRDADLAGIFETHGPPPVWSRPAGYPTLVRIILEQQVSLASARSVYRRIASCLGEVTPHRLLDAGESRLRRLGLTRQKSAYCIGVARAIRDGDLKLGRLRVASDDEARVLLMGLKGIGPWSADIYLLMALRRPDVWPAGDLALVTAVTRLKRLRGHPTRRRLERIAEPWRPYRAVAARMLWQYYLAGGASPGSGRAGRMPRSTTTSGDD